MRLFISAVLMFYAFSIQALPSEPSLIELSESPYWHQLLHYRAQGLLNKTYSQGDDAQFFLSTNGMLDPLVEIEVSVQKFSMINMVDNESAQCRFPARYHWLKSQLEKHHFIDQKCSDFKKFFNDINGESLTIIYPASYLNSPSSMYGHTLVRIDRKDKTRSQLLAYSVNFAANTDRTDNDIVFSYKGMFGGYPGVVSVTPYYQKVNEYSALESRDIWEYQLNIEKHHVNQFVRHIWETKDTWFDYYFISENCSYRLLALLDAAVPNLNLANEFPGATVPVDTIRVLYKNNLVKNVLYRPSVSSELNAMQQQVPHKIQTQAKILVESPQSLQQNEFLKLTNEEQAQALELAFAYTRYLSVQEKKAKPALRKTSLKILSKRSKIAIKDVFSKVSPPIYRDDQGHKTQRIQISSGKTQQQEFKQLGFRMTYHDLLDPVAGFLPGAQIQMGNISVRQYQNDELKVQDFNVIDITSLSTRNNFIKPAAWRVSGAFKRLPGLQNISYWTLNGGRGVAYELLNGITYGLIEGELATGSELDKEYRLAAGVKLGWLYQKNNWQISTSLLWQDSLAGMEGETQDVKIGFAYNPKQDFQVRVSMNQQKWLSKTTDDVSLGIGFYF